MSWSAVISSDDVVAIHAVLVPTSDGDGEILLFGGDDHDRAANIAGHWDHARRFNCRHPGQPLTYVASPNVDLFCCGHACLGDGRVLVAGGTITFPPESEGPHAHIHFEGHRHAFIYNPAVGAFSEVASMGFEPGTTRGGGRWYPSLCTLPSGDVLAVAGHPAGDDSRHNNNHPERYRALDNRWVMLQATGPDAVGGPDLYPRLHVLRDGSVFISSALQGNTSCIAIDPGDGSKRVVCALPDGAYQGFNCPSVLLPLTPTDNYRPRVLLCGGAASQLVDLGAAAPAWANVPRSGATAGLARTHACATILPTGDVLMTGGADPNNDQAGVMDPELYATPIDHAAGVPAYVAGTGGWSTLDDPATVLRNYHSSALLMPDGRVWTAGGNSPNQPDMPPTATQEQIEIFDPPYPAGPRPTITHCPRAVAHGQTFMVDSPQAGNVHAVTLLRCGSSTHAFNPDQRCVFLPVVAESPTRLRVTAPPNGAVAPPGNYMLFLIDDGGRPCQYASFLHVGGLTSPRLPARAPVGVVSRSTDHLDIFTTDADGVVRTAAWEPAFADWWHGWWELNRGRAAPGAPVIAVSRNTDKLDAFVVGTDNHVYTAAWEPGFTDWWHGWWRLRDGVAAPGAYVTAVSRSTDKLDVFVVGTDGRVWTAAWEPAFTDGWHGWWPIGNIRVPAGAPIHVVSRSADKLDIFVTDVNGVVQTAAWEPAFTDGWHGWWELRGGRAAPGAPVTAVSRGTDKLDVFVVGTDNRVWTAAWEPGFTDGWHGWWSVGNIRVPARAPVHAVSRSTDKLDIFATDVNGVIQTAAWEPAFTDGWHGWWDLKGGRAAPGAPVTAVSRSTDKLDVFVVGLDGRVWTAAWEPSFPDWWHGWWPIGQ